MATIAGHMEDGVKRIAASAIEEAAGLIPHPIPYLGRNLYPSSLKAVAKAVRKGYIGMGYMVGEPQDTAGYTDHDQKGALILLPSYPSASHIFTKSCAVHEAIHAAVDAAGHGSPFKISVYTHEFIAHLGQTCYAIAKKADVTQGNFARYCCKDAEPAARAFAATGKIPRDAFDQLLDAIKGTYRYRLVNCAGWRASND